MWKTFARASGAAAMANSEHRMTAIDSRIETASSFAGRRAGRRARGECELCRFYETGAVSSLIFEFREKVVCRVPPALR